MKHQRSQRAQRSRATLWVGVGIAALWLAGCNGDSTGFGGPFPSPPEQGHASEPPAQEPLGPDPANEPPAQDPPGPDPVNEPPAQESPAPTSGEVVLSWDAPAERVDGSPLTALGGYTIHYGRSADRLDDTIELDNPGLSRYVVEGLEPGEWHFAMTARDRSGQHSSFSGVVSIILD